MRATTEQLLPGRWDAVREPSAKERAATRVLALSLEEASVKVRTGAPVDNEEDHGMPVWADVLPVRQVSGGPETAPSWHRMWRFPPMSRSLGADGECSGSGGFVGAVRLWGEAG